MKAGTHATIVVQTEGCVGPRLRGDDAVARSSHMATKTKRAHEPKLNTYRSGPDERGFFGLFGGRFVAETLMPLILELERAYDAAKADPAFQQKLTSLNTHYAGRPSPLYFAERMTEHFGGAKSYFK